MNYGPVVSNSEIISLINDKLLKLQSEIFDTCDVQVPKNKKQSIVKKAIAFILYLVAFTAIAYVFLVRAPGFSFLPFMLSVVSVSSGLLIHSSANKNIQNSESLLKEQMVHNPELESLQNVRDYIYGKKGLTIEIGNQLEQLKKEIIKNRNAEYRQEHGAAQLQNCGPVSAGIIDGTIKPAIKVAGVVRDSDIIEWTKGEYQRLKTEAHMTPSAIMAAISQGLWYKTYNTDVTELLREMAYDEIAYIRSESGRKL